MNRVVQSSIRIASLILLLILTCAGAIGQAGTPPAASAPAQASAPPFDNRVFAESDKLVHVSRVKVGDTVTAHLTAPAKLRDGSGRRADT